MIPIQLTIEGLYSYQNRQTIDFSNLTEAGLFGIFGAVGSGKSSILEAITFALYGETERLNARDKRAYNMMNLKSNRSYIEFDFLNFENKTFRVTREFKRNSKRFEDVKSPTVVFYQWVDHAWSPLPHSNAYDIIGLSYENFKRTIIIPQGQFKEFIELGAKDRTLMMKEIFNLHRFDLQDKVAVLAKKNQSDLDQLQGKLSGFEEVSEEKIQILKSELDAQKEQADIVQKEYQIVNEKFQQLKALKEDFERLKSKKIEFETIEGLKPKMDQRQLEVDTYDKIYKTFHHVLNEQLKIETEKNEKSLSIDNQKKQLKLIENEISEIANKVKVIQPLYEELGIKKQEENDLELIRQNLVFSQEIIKLKDRTKNGIAKVDEVLKDEKNILLSIDQLEVELKQINQSKIDAKVLMEVNHWFTQHQTIQKNIQEETIKIQEYQKQLESFQTQISSYQVDATNYKEVFEGKLNELQVQKSTLEQQKNELDVQQKLAQYAHNLEQGSPCPLCGADHHPNVVELEDVSTKIEKVSNELKLVTTHEKQIQSQLDEVKQLVHQFTFIQQQKEQVRLQEKELKSELEKLDLAFSWQEFSSKDYEGFVLKKNEALLIEETIKQKNNTLNTLRQNLQAKRIEVDKYRNALEQFKLEEAQKASQIQQNESNLKVLKSDNYRSKSLAEIDDEWNNLKAKNHKIESDYQKFNQLLNDLNPKLAAKQSSIKLLEQQVEMLNQELIQLQNQIKINLTELQIDSIEEVTSVLKTNLDVDSIRKEIEAFKIQYESLKTLIIELEQKLEKVQFDESSYAEEEEKLKTVTEKLKTLNAEVTRTLSNIERLEKEFEAKKELLSTLDNLQKRAANLQVLRNLFNSAGFVQYVSSIYLRQLCENANVRFHRMTRNQLSLQINENNDFEIIDYLNEGRPRSVKTLSGGQAFQVSLSLALALAESVQSNSKAERNFFFIDEGFGTQDAEAVNIVFETLNHLQKENRIVGIISHVEELKERIPVALTITKDEETGSKISLA